MKKNVMMRVASIMLVLVLMTSTVISGTFAKYVTSKSGSDEARVAKWGVGITPNGNLFLTQYDKTDGTYTLGDKTVISGDTWKLVAPGTSHDLTEVVLTGSPEVATRVTYDATVTLDAAAWEVNGDEYCPIIFTVEGETYGIQAHVGATVLDNVATDIADLKAQVEAAIEACKRDYAPLQDLSAVSGDYPTVSWQWPFSTSDANDYNDTQLGDKAVANDITISVSVATTVTQID